MALKDWKRYKNEPDWITYENEKVKINIVRVPYGKEHKFVVRFSTINSAIKSHKYFKNKKEALAFAKNYMKKH
jgi:hypothetical protein